MQPAGGAHGATSSGRNGGGEQPYNAMEEARRRREGRTVADRIGL
jgi:hypothetical protein